MSAVLAPRAFARTSEARPVERHPVAPHAHEARAVATAHLRTLDVDDLPALLALQDAVVGGLPAGFMRAKTRAEMHGFANRTLGFVCGVWHAERLVAAACLRVPDCTRENPAPGMTLVPPQDWPRHTAILETALVLASARGHGYQRALIDARRVLAEAAGMRWLAAGVRLDNPASWRNLLACGLVVSDVRVAPGPPSMALVAGLGGPTAQRGENARGADCGPAPAIP